MELYGQLYFYGYCPIHTFIFIRNRFIRNWTSARQKIKKLQGWSRGDLRNFQIEKIKKLNRDKKKES